ncbi:MAG: GAF domain-containing protein [Rhodospirillaceae bacterium]|nr:GAF domain-containing protein [Rhodospirillaceae bacterium]
MEQNYSNENHDRQRRWERLEYQTGMALLLEDGRRFEGVTLDVSLTGVLLKTENPPEGLIIGDLGELHIIPTDENLRFPCKVVRITDTKVGLNFHDKQSSFGMFVTHDMMLDLLTSINNAFSASLDLESTIETSVTHIKDYLQSEAASLFLWDEENKTIVCGACAGPVDITGITLEPNEGVVGWVIQQGIPHIVHDVMGDSYFSRKVDEKTGFRTESILCAPLRIKDKIIGALEVINKRGSGLYAGHDRIVLTALASATAMAIHNARQADAQAERDAAIKANKAKSEFLSSMSHELRTPLNAIIGYSQMLAGNQKSNMSQSERGALGNIVKGGEHLLSLVNEVLDLARIESDQLELEITEVSPAEAIEGAMIMANNMAEKNQVTIHEDPSLKSMPKVWADEKRLSQIVLNLLSNAVKYNHDNGNVTIASALTSDGMLRLSVTDNGPGISKEKQERLFQPFSRLGMEKSANEGTGIGLTISKKLVEMMDGRIGFESQAEKGTIFWFDLPVVL